MPVVSLPDASEEEEESLSLGSSASEESAGLVASLWLALSRGPSSSLEESMMARRDLEDFTGELDGDLKK